MHASACYSIHMKKQHVIIGALVLLTVVGVIFWQINESNNGNDVISLEEAQQVREEAGDPVEITMDFYKEWLNAVQDITASPYTSGVLDNPVLGDTVRAYVRDTQEAGSINGIDPVLCQSITPKKLRSKVLAVHADTAEILVLAKLESGNSPEQAAVSLQVVDGAWQITNISCASGESAPEREFSFAREGFLLKSVPAPLDSRYWHLVFEQNGELGHTVPLFFDADSICIALDESEAVCDENLFTDAEKAFVQAQMTETGAMVKRLQLLNEEE